MAYMKKLREGTEGEWEVIKIDDADRDVYLAKSWGDATEGEYNAQVEAAEAPEEVDSPDDSESPEEEAPEGSADDEAAEEPAEEETSEEPAE